MKTISHEEQQIIWEEEHQKPTVLLQMVSDEVSTSVKKFWDWFKPTIKQTDKLNGLEICCGKGRNVIWLAQQGVRMIGIDFSPSAIQEAQKRAQHAGVEERAQFLVQDATQPYPMEKSSLDFVIDCFGSTDIESSKARKATLDNIIKVLRPGGYLLVYLLSTDHQFHQETAKKSPGPDEGSFIHPVTGKYEKAFTETEIRNFYSELDLVSLEHYSNKSVFAGKKYDSRQILGVFQKKLVTRSWWHENWRRWQHAIYRKND